MFEKTTKPITVTKCHEEERDATVYVAEGYPSTYWFRDTYMMDLKEGVDYINHVEDAKEADPGFDARHGKLPLRQLLDNLEGSKVRVTIEVLE